MRNISLLFIICIVGMPVYAQQTSGVASDNILHSRIDSIVHGAALNFMSTGNRVGLSIGVIENGHQYFYNYGETEKGKSQLPTKNSVYELASVTKTFESFLLARAVIEKKVKLTDDIRLYLDETYPNLEFEGTPITLLNIANLTSGLPNWMPDKQDLFYNVSPDSIPFVLDRLHRSYSRKDFYRDLHEVKLSTKPGTMTRHCNTAAQLLGFIMEKVYGAPFQDLITRYFVDPLKMTHTVILSEGSLPHDLVSGYDGKGRLMPYIVWQDLQVAASLGSTASDMIKYLNYQMAEKDQAVLLSHQITNGTIAEGGIGLNWKISTDTHQHRWISHTGGSLGFSTYVEFLPDQKKGVVLLSNEADPKTQEALIDLARRIIEPKKLFSIFLYPKRGRIWKLISCQVCG